MSHRLRMHLDKFLPLYVISGMLLGYLMGMNIDVKPHKEMFKALNMIVVISMIYPMMINLKVDELKDSIKLWKPISIALVIGLVVPPILMYLLAKFTSLFFPVSSQLSLGLILAVVVPCSSMAIAYTGFVDGNLELATILVVISFTLAIGVVPLWLKVFASAYHLSISAWLLVKTILIVIFIPLGAGILTRYFLLKKLGTKGFSKLKPLFSSISLLGMYTMVTLIFMEKTKLIASKPSVVLMVFLPLLLYYVIELAFLTFFDKLIGVSYKDHMAITFTSVGKNQGTAMAIAMAAGMGVMAIPAAVTPIFQIAMLVGYVKLAKFIKRYYGCECLKRLEKLEREELEKLR